ncbi:CLUMA_CG010089, isoform A [Clunio marinus]|uniref:CLUMA_CG010089, isoform A n=1 Tax=Clunio marinus TaxID=568069 RepID=A0A1J1IAH5_9DIPT|nr:CLUMA_CG010089, isoform A [Clunio marinus]
MRIFTLKFIPGLTACLWNFSSLNDSNETHKDMTERGKTSSQRSNELENLFMNFPLIVWPKLNDFGICLDNAVKRRDLKLSGWKWFFSNAFKMFTTCYLSRKVSCLRNRSKEMLKAINTLSLVLIGKMKSKRFVFEAFRDHKDISTLLTDMPL